MAVSILVAVAENGVIGRDGDLPWRLSSDLRRFKRLTMGHAIIMGRKTFESIGRLLPGRTTIVVTRQPDFDALGAATAESLAAALRLSDAEDEVFVVGGGEIYRAALPLARRIYLTRVHAVVDGDTTFPELDDSWRLLQRSEFPADDQNDHPSTFEVWESS